MIGATSATWQYDVTLPAEGEWRMSATAIDDAGQSDLRSDTRDWTISSTGVAPTVAINTPVTMTPPTAAAPLTVARGGRPTFSGTANDEDSLVSVKISLRNASTREALAADGTWSATNASGSFCRISGAGSINAASYNWTYTTPFDLTPGVYTFRVRATDNLDLTTSTTNQGTLTINAQYTKPDGTPDGFPNGLLTFPVGWTGVDQNIETLHLTSPALPLTTSVCTACGFR